MSDAAYDRIIAAAIRGEAAGWPFADGQQEDFIHRARYHGVAALLHERHGQLGAWPDDVLETLRQDCLTQAMWEMRHQHVVARLVTALGSARIDTVIMKGTALAYQLYDNPVWRPRGDTDIVIDQVQLDRCKDVLRAEGFDLSTSVDGELVKSEETWVRTFADGTCHAIDVHWKLNNSPLLAALFSFDELSRNCTPIPALGPAARGLNRIHAFVVACMHCATHVHNPYYVDGTAHFGADRLIWLYDIRLLADRMDDAECIAAVDLAAAKGLRGPCHDAFTSAQRWLGSRPQDKRLLALGDASNSERTAEYLRAGGLKQKYMDFCAIEGNANKLAYAKELLFPSAAYMRAKYAGSRGETWLAFLYARRAMGGLMKSIRRGREDP